MGLKKSLTIFQGIIFVYNLLLLTFFGLIILVYNMPVSVAAGTQVSLARFDQAPVLTSFYQKTWAGNISFSSDSVNKRTNYSSILMSADVLSDGEVYSPLIPVSPNSRYGVSYWVRTAYTSTIPAQASMTPVFGQVIASQYNSYARETDAPNQNRVASGYLPSMNLGGVNDWTLAVYYFYTTSSTSFVRLRASFTNWGSSTGAVWYDDLRITRGDPSSTIKAYFTGLDNQTLFSDFKIKLWEGNLFFSEDKIIRNVQPASLKISSPTGANGEVYSYLIPVSPSTEYEMSYWVRANYSQSDGQVLGRVLVSEYNLNAKEEDAVNINRVSDGRSYGTNVDLKADWTLKNYKLITSPSTRFVRIRIMFSGWGKAAGSVWFDDIRISPASITPPTPTNNSYKLFIEDVIGYWRTKQDSSGNFYDELDNAPSPNDHYAHTHLGATFVWLGLKNNDDDLVMSGVRAINYYIDLAEPKGHQPFNQFAVAYSYNLLKNNPKFYPMIKEKWEAYLRAARKMDGSDDVYLSNWQLVEAAAAKEILTTGLVSTTGDSRTFLKDPAYWADYYDHKFVESLVPAKLTAKGLGGDPGSWPTAYHAFATNWVARYYELYPQSTIIKNYFVRMADTTLNLMGPDGDFAYFGRSNQQSFALASMIYYFEVAAKLNTSKSSQYKAAAERAFMRLKETNGVSPKGFIYIIPKLKSEFTRDSLDGYAHLGVYNGLTLLILTMASDTMDNTVSASTIPADNDFSYTEPEGPGFSAMRKGNIWMVVSKGLLPTNPSDVRYDTGLIRAKKYVGGKWVDLVPARPYPVGLRFSLNPRGFYDSTKPYFLVGERLNTSLIDGTIRMDASLWDRNGVYKIIDIPLTQIIFKTDGKKVLVKAPPQNPRVNNYYTFGLFSKPPVYYQLSNNSYQLTDDYRSLTITLPNIPGRSDLFEFHNSDIGKIFFDGFNVFVKDQEVTYSFDTIERT